MLHTEHSFLSALFHQSHYHTEVSCQPMRLNTWDFWLDSSYCDLHHSGSQEIASLKLHPCIVTNHDFIFLAKKCLQPVTLHGSSWVNNMGSGHVHVHPGTGVTWHCEDACLRSTAIVMFSDFLTVFRFFGSFCDLRLDTWDTDYISDNWELQYEQLHCDLWIQSDGDSIRNSCDVLYIVLFAQ